MPSVLDIIGIYFIIGLVMALIIFIITLMSNRLKDNLKVILKQSELKFNVLNIIAMNVACIVAWPLIIQYMVRMLKK